MTMRERLAAVYAKIPKIACQRKCQSECTLIIFSTIEGRLMRRHSPPEHPPRKDDPTCPHLDVAFGSCSVYGDRPAICRLWGVVPELPCPYGCVPERILSRSETEAILLDIIEIDRSIVGEHVVAGYDLKAVERINARMGVRPR